MTPTLFCQYLNILLIGMLVARVVSLKLESKYLAFLMFIGWDSIETVIYLVYVALQHHGLRVVDYRIIWVFTEVATWLTTIWVVYSLLIATLKNLPGILRFSLRFLNVVFAVALSVALFTIGPEYTAYGLGQNPNWLRQIAVSTRVIARALSMAELLVIVCVLIFVLRFPLRIPRNLAAFNAGISVFLLLTITFGLMESYIPWVSRFPGLLGLPSYYMAGCLLFWIFSIDAAGEETTATLGRNWKAVPQAHLVQQLEAMNAALLRSREQT